MGPVWWDEVLGVPGVLCAFASAGRSQVPRVPVDVCVVMQVT